MTQIFVCRTLNIFRRVKNRKDLTVIYEIKGEKSNKLEDKRIVTKILKIDENNQYGNAVTVKKQKFCPNLRKFNLFIENLLPGDKISHLFIVDIKYDVEHTNKRPLPFNEIYTPVFGKKKVPSERSAFSLMGTMKKNGKVPVNFVLNIIIKY